MIEVGLLGKLFSLHFLSLQKTRKVFRGEQDEEEEEEWEEEEEE